MNTFATFAGVILLAAASSCASPSGQRADTFELARVRRMAEDAERQAQEARARTEDLHDRNARLEQMIAQLRAAVAAAESSNAQCSSKLNDLRTAR